MKGRKLLSAIIAGAMMLSMMSFPAFAAPEPAYQETANAVGVMLLSYEDSWIDSAVTNWYTADGTEFTLSTAEQLAGLASLVNNGTSFQGKTIKLSNDIDLNGKNWTPIGKSGKTFQGIFDGQEKVIKNLTIPGSNSDVGLFGFTTNGEIKNFTLENASVQGYLDVGAVAGTPYTSKYSNITVTGLIQVDGYAYVGGALGKNAYADITNVDVIGSAGSYVKADSEAYRTYVGGLVGFMGEGNTTISDCDVKIDVTGSTCDVGGITGILHYGNKMVNCTYEGSLAMTNAIYSENAGEIGGLAGTFKTNPSYVTSIEDSSAVINNAVVNNGTGSTDITDDITAVGTVYSEADKTSGECIIQSTVNNRTETFSNIAAKIGDTKYTTLAAALAAASNGDTVTIWTDISDMETVTVLDSQNITIDLNGKTIAAAVRSDDPTKHYYAIDNYGTLTLNDSVGGGTISARGIENYGTMTINGGTYLSIDERNGGAAVWNEGNLVINGGTFKSTYRGTASDYAGAGCLNNSGTALITGGTFTGNSARTYAIISTGNIEVTPGEGKEVNVSGVHGGIAADSGSMVINGGNYSSEEYYGLYVSNDGTGTDPQTAFVTVNGGTFSGASYSVWIGSDYNNPVNSSIEINGGTFDKPLNAQENTREGAIVVQGGTFSSDVSEYCADGFSPKLVNGVYVVDDAAGTITVKFVQPEGEKNVYDIVLDGNDQEIYEFVSAELQFANASKTLTNTPMNYEITGTDNINVVANTEKPDRYGFYLKDGAVANRMTGTELTIGQVTFPAQGNIDFGVTAEDSTVIATLKGTHLETTYTATGASKLEAGTPINSNVAAATRNVAVNVDFVHDIDGTVWTDNQMTVTLKDAFGDITTKALSITNNAGTAAFENIPVGRITVILEAPGFRKYTYTTIVEEGADPLVLSFWNDTKRDTIQSPLKAIEAGKAKIANNFVVGDIAMDYMVDKYDLAAVTSYYGTYGLTDESKIKYDLNRDGNIDITDVAYVLHNFGF